MDRVRACRLRDQRADHPCRRRYVSSARPEQRSVAVLSGVRRPMTVSTLLVTSGLRVSSCGRLPSSPDHHSNPTSGSAPGTAPPAGAGSDLDPAGQLSGGASGGDPVLDELVGQPAFARGSAPRRGWAAAGEWSFMSLGWPRAGSLRPRMLLSRRVRGGSGAQRAILRRRRRRPRRKTLQGRKGRRC